MRTGLRNALVLSLLVTAAALTWYWSRPAAERPGQGGDAGPALGYSMLDVVLTVTNAEGLAAFEISTARLTEVPAEERVVFESLVAAQTLDDSAWRISADTATGPSDGSSLAMEGNAVIRLERAAGEPYVLRMPRLELDQSTQVARARGPIELTVGTTVLTAEALEVDLNARGLKLESVKGMKTSHLTSAVAAAALSAAATAQDDAAGSRERRVAWESSECLEECVIRKFALEGDHWRLEAGEARTAELDSWDNGELRLTDVRFTLDDIALATPTAVFEFADGLLAEAALTGEIVRFESGGARFSAQRLVFTFEGGELATATLSGNPAVFEHAERGATATAETISYDYREQDVRVTGPFTLNREGRAQLRCMNLDTSLYYDLDTPRVNSGPCVVEGVQGDRAAEAARDGEARAGEAPTQAPAVEPAPDGTP